MAAAMMRSKNLVGDGAMNVNGMDGRRFAIARIDRG